MSRDYLSSMSRVYFLSLSRVYLSSWSRVYLSSMSRVYLSSMSRVYLSSKSRVYLSSISRVRLYVPFTAVAVNCLKTNDVDASYVNFFLAQALEPTERAPKPVERAMEGL